LELKTSWDIGCLFAALALVGTSGAFIRAAEVDYSVLPVNVGHKKAENLLITSQEDLSRLWKLWRTEDNYCPKYPSASIPSIDFSKNDLIVASRGQSGSSAYSVRIEKIVATGSELQVFVTLNNPGRSCFTTADMACAVVYATIPKLKKPVKFVQETKTFECGKTSTDSVLAWPPVRKLLLVFVAAVLLLTLWILFGRGKIN
jgi:hypothetical protein